MPSESVAHDDSGALRKQSIERIRGLLTEALEIVDALDLSPEIGARIQEAISALEAGSGAKAS